MHGVQGPAKLEKWAYFQDWAALSITELYKSKERMKSGVGGGGACMYLSRLISFYAGG